MNISNEDYAYIAGLWDADGSYMIAKHIGTGKHNAKRGFVWEIRMSIGMKETQALDFVKNKFKKNRLRVTKLPSGKPFYHLTLYGNEIREHLPNILPYVKVKKKQAKIILKALSILKPKSDIIIDRKIQKMYLNIKNLNGSRYLIK